MQQPSEITRKHRPDYQIVLFMGLIMMLGLVVMYAIGPQRAHVLNTVFGTDNYSSTFFFFRQSISLLLALAAFFLMAKLPYRSLFKHSRILVMIGVGLCLLVAIAGAMGLGIAQCSHGACRWIDLGPLGTVQPAEFLKFAILIFTASLLGARYREGRVNDRMDSLLPVGVLCFITLFFVVWLQQDMGTGLSIIALLAAMLVGVGLDKRTGLMLLGGITALGILMVIIAPHRIERVTAFFAGDSTSTDDPEAYHITHAKIAIGSGGFLGVGIGNSIQATGYLPEAINDSVFAIMGETFGFVGLVAILAIFTALMMRILRVADHLPDMTARLIAIGVFGWFGAHVILNIAAMTGIFPLTGITLPLLSFGGTSMVFIAGALGLVFQLSRYTMNTVNIEGGAREDTRSGRGLGRTRYANRGSTR